MMTETREHKAVAKGKKAQVIRLLQASINLTGARTELEAAGEATDAINAVIWQVDRAIGARLQEREGCQHLSGYWINKETGNFRCYRCGFQFFTKEVEPNKKRKIERWTA